MELNESYNLALFLKIVRTSLTLTIFLKINRLVPFSSTQMVQDHEVIDPSEGLQEFLQLGVSNAGWEVLDEQGVGG